MCPYVVFLARYFEIMAIEWTKVNNPQGRVVYQMRIPDKYSFVVSGIIDYDPAKPRFKAVAKFPDVQVQWFDGLDEAQEFLIARYFEWVLSK